MQLSHRIAISVPSTQGLAGEITGTEHINRTHRTASHLFEQYGGATVHSVQGYYKSDDGQLVEENISRVVSYTDSKTLGKTREHLFNYAGTLCREYNQESIMLEIDNTAHFINSNEGK